MLFVLPALRGTAAGAVTSVTGWGSGQSGGMDPQHWQRPQLVSDLLCDAPEASGGVWPRSTTCFIMLRLNQ